MLKFSASSELSKTTHPLEICVFTFLIFLVLFWFHFIMISYSTTDIKKPRVSCFALEVLDYLCYKQEAHGFTASIFLFLCSKVEIVQISSEQEKRKRLRSIISIVSL